MGKKYAINCGTAMLLRNKPEILEAYEKVYINCGSAVISTKLQEALNKMNVTINCGNMTFVDVEGEIAVLEGDVRVTEKASYGHVYLVAKNNLVIEQGSLNALQNVTGVYVSGTLYLPDSIDRTAIRNLMAEHVTQYPDDAKVIVGDLELREEEAAELAGGVSYWVSGQVTALDKEALEALKKKGVTVHGCRLLISQELMLTYEGVVQGDQKTMVPEGHYVLEDVTLGAETSVLYGDRIYVRGHFRVNLADSAYLNDFKSIIVKGRASLPLSCAAGFKQIGKAEEMFVYEGELLRINGAGKLTHAMLEAAKKAGISYTVKANGQLMVEDDVTVDDLSCIKAVYYNGLVNISEELKPIFSRVVKVGNGQIGRLEDLADQYAPGLLDDDTVKLNTGSFFL